MTQETIFIIVLTVLLAITIVGSVIENKKAKKRYKQLESDYLELQAEYHALQDDHQELINKIDVKEDKPITKN